MVKLAPIPCVPTSKRHNGIGMLSEICTEWSNARDIECAAHCTSSSIAEYVDKMHQVIWNIKQNPKLEKLGANLVLMTDEEMAKGSIIEDIEYQNRQRRLRFDQIVQEKYDMVNKETYRATLICRRCGSSDVTCEQKQTRGADEAMTVFCTCGKCNQRWTMR